MHWWGNLRSNKGKIISYGAAWSGKVKMISICHSLSWQIFKSGQCWQASAVFHTKIKCPASKWSSI